MAREGFKLKYRINYYNLIFVVYLRREYNKRMCALLERYNNENYFINLMPLHNDLSI